MMVVDLELSATEHPTDCGCGDSHCETCFPDEQSDYCRPGAFYCPYRLPGEMVISRSCSGCKHAFTKKEYKEHMGKRGF